jgi:hypothetical protein
MRVSLELTEKQMACIVAALAYAEGRLEAGWGTSFCGFVATDDPGTAAVTFLTSGRVIECLPFDEDEICDLRDDLEEVFDMAIASVEQDDLIADERNWEDQE